MCRNGSATSPKQPFHFDRNDPSTWAEIRMLDDFEQSARAAGTRPALLFIPVVNNWAEGRAAPRYANFLQEERLQDSSFIVIDVADAEFDLARFSILPFRGHPSVFGNEVIAGHILATAAPDLDFER